MRPTSSESAHSPTTPPALAIILASSSLSWRAFQMIRPGCGVGPLVTEPCDQTTGTFGSGQRALDGRRRAVREIDEHAEPVAFADDLAAKLGQAVVHGGLGLEVTERAA